MHERDKAKELFNHFFDSDMGGHGFLPAEEAKKQATFIVSEIIEALEITTGHCELRLLDRQEVHMDFEY